MSPRRSTKYLNAREYAERLYLSDNRDVQGFALAFIEALDAQEENEADEIKAKIEEYTDNLDDGTALERLKWLNDEAETLAGIEEKIHDVLPEYKDAPIEEIVDALVKLKEAAKLLSRPVQEYDL